MKLITFILGLLLTSAALADSMNPHPAQVDGLCELEESHRSFKIYGKDPAMFYGVFAEGGTNLSESYGEKARGLPRVRVYVQHDRVHVQSSGAMFSFTLQSTNAGTQTNFSFYIQTGKSAESREWVSCRFKILKNPYELN
ncbi:MAG: hypothetical protein H7061_08675 [Bdellovibrionaceae bacterium]|nr:hypothetical protein [Bdellovibrio sp.]